MKRTIELWIGDLRADLADDGFLLMNYTMEDLASPAVVRNAFSKQVTLPGTSANNRIFGEIFRNDRVAQYRGSAETGVYFDPTRKTTWRIYDGQSQLLDSGYLRLDSVTRKRNVIVEYKVTLYGGLGSFLYGLAYNESGEKRTLADLDFLGTANPATEMNFTLNAAAVRAAWTRIAQATGTPSQLWDIINFAPAYNGKPGGTFDADKGLLDVVSCGIAHDAIGTVGGLALVELAKEYTEWQTKDLRSYLQRPVVRLRSIIEAICASRNNGGWSVSLDQAFFDDGNPYWQKTWMTLPIVDTDNILTEAGGSGTLQFSQVGGDPSVVEATLAGGGDATKNYMVQIQVRPSATLPSSATGTLYLHCDYGGTAYMSYVQYLINAYDSSNNLVAQTVLRVSSRQPDIAAGDVPQMDAVGTFTGAGTSASWDGNALTAAVSGAGIAKIRVTASTVALKWGAASANTPDGTAMWANPLSYASLLNATRYIGDFGGSGYNYGGIDGGRSGKTVTKAVLLSGGGTPADYLLSLCKTFGLVIVADAATKTVSIEMRSSFYRTDVVDITDRIDTDEGVEKVPFAFSAKWYVWAAKYENGEWAKSYADKYGRTFGQHLVDTGYSFDANANGVLDSVIFRGAVMALENSKYYCAISEGGYLIPSVLLDRGAKYSITASATSTEEKDINVPSEAAAITWMNPTNPSYDLFPKAQFHDKEDAPAEGRDVLLFLDGIYDSGGGIVTEQLPWNALYLATSTRGAKYVAVTVKAGDVITAKASDYSVWRISMVVSSSPNYGSGTTVSDTGWKYADITKTISSTEDGNYLRIAIARRDNAAFSLADAEAALTEALALRESVSPSGDIPYTLTDDTPTMLSLNGGTPCWLLAWGAEDPSTIIPMLPKFSRYLDYSEQHQGYVYERSLDFGTPAEVPIPAITFRDGATVWPAYWARYIADRYDDDSAVVRCKVNLAGMQVGHDLFRRFYFFDGAVWALNKISNYSMTTWDLAECEFVKVQDIANYTE